STRASRRRWAERCTSRLHAAALVVTLAPMRCPSCGNEVEPSRFCPECGERLEQRELPRRRFVTALFCDVVGSTELGERTDPEALQATLDAYFAAMRSAIERHGGEVEKFIGD